MAGDDNHGSDASQHPPAGPVQCDGGVPDRTIPIQESVSRSKHLERLAELERTDPQEVDKEEVVRSVRGFLSTTYSGSAHCTGLRIAAKLIVTHGLTRDQLGEVSIEHEPQTEVVRWALENNEKDATHLSDSTVDFCCERREWRRILLAAVVRSGEWVALEDDQLVTLSKHVPIQERTDLLLDPLLARGLEDTAADHLEQYFEYTDDKKEPPGRLQTTSSLGFEKAYLSRLEVSLNRWRVEDDVDTLEQLVELGRREELYDEVLSAVERWLWSADSEPTVSGKHHLLAAAVEALLCREGTGEREAVILFKRYLSSAESLTGVEPELFDAAEEAGEQPVVEDVLDAYESKPRDDLGRADEFRIAARSAERHGRWEEAYELWQRAIEEDPNDDVYERAIENRLHIREIDEADRLVDQFREFTEKVVEATAYQVRIAKTRGDYRRVVGLVEDSEEVLTLPEPLGLEVTEAYVQSLANLGRWEVLHTFLEERDTAEDGLNRFYHWIATLKRFTDGAVEDVDGNDALDIAERLFTAPLTTDQLRFVLNVGIAGELADEIRGSYPEETDRLLVVEGLAEILISLHAERLIDALNAEGIRTDKHEEMLADIDLRRGGRQLLSTLDREARREGVITNANN